jgi:hypothetical protein
MESAPQHMTTALGWYTCMILASTGLNTCVKPASSRPRNRGKFTEQPAPAPWPVSSTAPVPGKKSPPWWKEQVITRSVV